MGVPALLDGMPYPLCLCAHVVGYLCYVIGEYHWFLLCYFVWLCDYCTCF